MAITIHPTATVCPTAILGDGCFIGPYCYVGPRVTMGRDNRLEAYVSVGTAAEHRDHFRDDPGSVSIGDHNVFREFVTVNGGTVSSTTVRSHCVMLRGSHVGHDATLRDHVNLSCNVLIGGHAIVGRGANLGLQCALHQHRVVGAYAMIGMSSAITRHVVPFTIAFGVPSRPQRINRIGLARAGVPEAQLQKFENWFQIYDQTGAAAELDHEFNTLLGQYHEDCRESGQSTPLALA